MSVTMNNFFKMVCITTPLLLGGCLGDTNSDLGTGTVSVSIKDGPVDSASAVEVTFTGIELKPYSGSPITVTFDTPKTIDLLQQQGTNSVTLLDSNVVTGGTYSWVRLIVDQSASYLVNSTGTHNLTIPSGDETGLKINDSFTVPKDGTVSVTIDFDLRKSVLEPATGSTDYKLKPVLHLVQNDKSGNVSGTVSSTLVHGSGCGSSAVYLFEGSGVTADDVDGIDPDPYGSSLVKLNNTSGNYEYEIGYVPAGDYTIAFTCLANLDDPETNDSSVIFSGTTNVTVTAGNTTTQNF